MIYKKFGFLTGILIVLLIIVQPVFAEDFTWHSAISKDASWSWEVTVAGGDIEEFFGYALANLEEDMIISVNATADPPITGDWFNMVSSDTVGWADIYLNQNTAPGREEIIYFFVTPINVEGSTVGETYGWQRWVVRIHVKTAMIYAINCDLSNTTSGDTILYECSTYQNDWTINHEINYDTSTGLLIDYTYTYTNATHTSSVAIERYIPSTSTTEETSDDESTSGGILDNLDIPGFGTLDAIFGVCIIVVIIRRRH